MQHKPLQGFLLSLLTAVMWGLLPIFLKISLLDMDAITITSYRFLFAFLVVFVLLKMNNSLPTKRQFEGKLIWLLLLAALGLTINYVANVKGLELIDAESAQVLIQLAPFLLMLGGILFFKESFSNRQKLGAGVLLIGFVLFFERNFSVLFSGLGQYTVGVLIIIFAALAWVVYALVQKWLFSYFTAQQMTLIIYGAGTLILAPFTAWLDVTSMSWLTGLSLLFCCFNTLIAYGAFTSAMSVWQASNVSAVISLTPIFTIISMSFAIEIYPDFFIPSDLNTVAYVGAVLVVIGSIITSLGKKETSS